MHLLMSIFRSDENLYLIMLSTIDRIYKLYFLINIIVTLLKLPMSYHNFLCNIIISIINVWLLTKVELIYY